MRAYPVVDLFAGPGGLGEGFSSHAGRRARFRLALSIERDPIAHRTLLLRAMFRRLRDRKIYYEYARAENADRSRIRDQLESRNPTAATAAAREAWCGALGEIDEDLLRSRIQEATQRSDRWVLIGGPPCQAYSLVGRSRMRRLRGALFETDERHLLYQEYLRIVANHAPPVFVMENVKGLLSSQLYGGPIFDRMQHDLSMPRVAIGGLDRGLRYRILSLGDPSAAASSESRRFVVRSEAYSIPQARHRVILMGVREDIAERAPFPTLTPTQATVVADVIGDLPQVRSALTGMTDSHKAWADAVAEGARVIRDSAAGEPLAEGVVARATSAAEAAKHVRSRGARFIPYSATPAQHSAWYVDDALGGLVDHVSRGHMRADLWRYLFAASHAAAAGRSPTLRDFPRALLPEHRNARVPAPIFADRFRVQLRDRPASTVTSHIAKDGNYFIHFDPAQCRSLTVREAARLQTFPDNYVFEGGHTQQFQQIGNAVPPYLARAIAEVVEAVLE